MCRNLRLYMESRLNQNFFFGFRPQCSACALLWAKLDFMIFFKFKLFFKQGSTSISLNIAISAKLAILATIAKLVTLAIQIFPSIYHCYLQGAGEVSFHPPCLEDPKGRLLPKALVPCCSYQGTMIGKNLGNFIYCDKFKPNVLHGQLCISLNLSQETSDRSAFEQKISLRIGVDQPSGFGLSGEEKSVATVHKDGIGGYTDSRPGKYFMTALKR